MKKSGQKIPYQISAYIKEHFREDFLFEVKDIRQVKGHLYYTIELSKDDVIHTLKFNEEGELMEDNTDPAFRPDDHDAPGFEETLE
jgi:hypothetical protein